jgi:hypothetical protein
MDYGNYYKDSAAQILDIMRETFGDSFREYFDGEPEMITDAQLPCMMVRTPNISIKLASTGTDMISETVTIIVSFNKADDIGAKQDTDLTMYRIRKLILGQDPSRGEDFIAPYYPRTVMGALRRYISLRNGTVDTEVTIEFDVNIRGGSQDAGYLATQEALITVTAYRNALVEVREG